ncbi:heparin lyase I family protein [Fertoebacter nigrum]|uniref:Heparin lyase I family protein n=1 Tax=Fertoeibacter niger TaxID=2656921 RepID=A0A8X8H277_9RHOB|nr:heparin lyase I family protein [Fertoeibacter niger]NUB44837.1 heparin lyase I family protein [Fertoeibacter niger]
MIVSLCATLGLAACGQQITVTLPGGGAGVASRAEAPRGHERLFSPAPHAFRFSQPGEPVRRGAVSERFELRDGDCGGSDCGTARYRAEIRELDRSIKARVGRDIWYGWSFYNDNIGAVTRDTSLGTVFGQWKLEGAQPPAFRIVHIPAGSGDWASCDPAICARSAEPADVVVELEDMRVSRGWGAAQNFGNICKLFSMEQNRGRWVDLVVNTNFSAGPDGYLRVWVNGDLKCNYAGPLVSLQSLADGATRPGNRRGIFASYTERWAQSRGTAPKPTMIVHYDEFLVGRSREDVDTRLREAAGQRPKD